MKQQSYASFYRKITAVFRKNRMLLSILLYGNIILTALMYIAYPLLLGYLLFTQDPRLFRFVMIPGVSFFLLSALREWINAPRPYDAENIEPLIKKDKTGRSMPSRHVFSSFLIAMAWLKVCQPAGIPLLLVSAAEAYIRVAGGVHYPKDVIAGALAGIICGLIL